jgi:hypothetical protein
MKRLLSFYQKEMTTLDWNRYNEIDLRFAHQVVARNTNVKELINETLLKYQADIKIRDTKTRSEHQTQKKLSTQ